MNVAREAKKNEMFKSLTGKKHAIPQSNKEWHNLLACSQTVKNDKGVKINKKALCEQFGISYHTGKLEGKKIKKTEYSSFKVIPYTSEHPTRELILS